MQQLQARHSSSEEDMLSTDELATGAAADDSQRDSQYDEYALTFDLPGKNSRHDVYFMENIGI